MEAHFPPAKLARFSESSTGMMVMTGGGGRGSGSGHVGLDLGLGPRMMNHGSKSGFTFLQLQELEHQALIFKYMAAGVPVPSHLVLPIWKSLAGTSSVSGMCPSFLGFRGVCFDYKSSTEPEPGRCRRTDGKKWRCSKDVVPDQKYCERHMHRGRNRSRKHVETTSQSNISLSSSEKTNSANESNNTNLSISIPLQLMTPNNTATTSMNSNYSRINAVFSSSRVVGLSPKSVLQTGICKTESPL